MIPDPKMFVTVRFPDGRETRVDPRMAERLLKSFPGAVVVK